ncbi:hypothetical protein GCM10010123_42710 [Pilimelia anulata]|uniref:Response regulatory domain-containing protein n=1 Tax=Pilimelia anulata TaxID=53371 RepID=A0A8J3FG88_9ACTN|nr:response regulator [Pilimelia anulata]GGK08241.1 hypothetical protein GCM10010123_42710 [Pilimelia anulata]
MLGTILVVDDDADNRELFAMMLERASYRALTADSAAVAGRLLRELPIDALLLDITLPELDGLRFCAQLRADPATATLPIMIVSGHALGKDVANGYAAGANDYLTKPFRRAELVSRLETMLGEAVHPPAAAALYARLAARAAAQASFTPSAPAVPVEPVLPAYARPA